MYLGALGFQLARRWARIASISSGVFSSPFTPTMASWRFGTSMRMRSPSSTSAIGAAYSGFRADMADDRAAACAGEAAVGDERHAGSQLRVGADGLAGVEHLGHTAAAGAFVTDEDGIAGLDLAVQNGGDARLLAVVGLGAQGGVKHVLGAGGVLDDTALRGQIALQDGDAAVGALGVVKAVDDVLAADRDAGRPLVFSARMASQCS